MKKLICPTVFPSINFEEIRKKVKTGISVAHNACEKAVQEAQIYQYQNKELTSEELQKATNLVMEEIFRTYCKTSYTRKVKSYVPDENDPKKDERSRKTIIYSMENATYCHLDVLLCSGSLIYMVTLETMNKPLKYANVCYYDERNMMRNDDSYLYCVLRDFSSLVYECKNLKYVFEETPDRPPRGVYMDNGSMFYEIHENRIVTPMHYYAGEELPHHVKIYDKGKIIEYGAKSISGNENLAFDDWFMDLFYCVK